MDYIKIQTVIASTEQNKLLLFQS